MIERLAKGQAEDLLHNCLEQGSVIPGRHFREELANEGLTFMEAWHVLRYGHIYDQSEQDLKTGEWKYRVEGYEPDGKWIVIVFCLKATDRAFLITIFSVKSRSR